MSGDISTRGLRLKVLAHGKMCISLVPLHSTPDGISNPGQGNPTKEGPEKLKVRLIWESRLWFIYYYLRVERSKGVLDAIKM